jgi:hypothetical protein
VATAANDDGVVTGLGRRAAPLFLPVLVVRHGVARKREDRKMAHENSFVIALLCTKAAILLWIFVDAGFRPGGRLTFLCFAKEK